MKTLMTKIKKLSLIALFAFATFGVAQVAEAATLNNDPQDFATLRVRNYTLNPSGNTPWYASVSANAGDELSFAIYYHNTGPDAATSLRMRLVPQNTAAGMNQTFTATVWATNAPAVTGTATVQLTSSQTIDFSTGSVVWRPNQMISTSLPLINGQTGSELFTAAGLDLGTIAPGWPTQGSVVLKYRVSNTGGNLAPTVNIVANPTSVNSGGSSIITWSSTNATTCTVSPSGWNGTAGSQSTGALFASQTYSVNCSGAGGTIANSVTVAVNGGGNLAPTVNIVANPTSVNSGGSSIITWSSTNATTCTVSPSGWNGTAGSQSTGALFASQTYSVNCSGAGGTIANSVTVSVGGGNGNGGIGTVTTYNPTGIAASSANLSCFFNNNNTTGTTGWFEYGTTPSFGSTVSNSAITTPVTLSYTISGLQQNTTYYTRCAIQNQFGISYGTALSFNTTNGGNGGNGQLLVITYPASSVYLNSAVLNGYVDPQGSNATRWFEYGTSISNLNNATVRVTHGATAYAVSDSITNLVANQTYYFRAAANNNSGTVYGSVQSFTTGSGSGPMVTTKPATGINSNYAVLNGNVSANANDTVRWFEWGSTASLGNSTTRVNTGGVSGDFSESIMGLTSGNTYYFRAVAENSSGRSYGTILNFNAGGYVGNPNGPVAVTLAATSIGATSGTLNGAGLLNVLSQGYGWFEWGSNMNLINTGSLITLARTPTAYFEENLTGLSAGTTYYYRAVVKDQNGVVSRGEIMSFRATTGTYYPPTVYQPKVYGATVVKRVQDITFLNGTDTNISANVGDLVRFTIEIVNSGDYQLGNVVVRDKIPDYLEFANANQQNVNNPQREVSWFVGVMDPGVRKSMTLDMIVTGNISVGSTIVNTATLQSNRVNATSNDVVIHVDVSRDGLSVIKDKSGDTAQTAGTFFSLDGFLRSGFFWFNLLFTLLVALLTIYVFKRLLQDKYSADQGRNNLQ
jgi:uncharacterized repeat protein (TIGR01451 family)